LADIVLHMVRRYRLISAEETVVVGVSGGPDSLSLLHVLWQLLPVLRCNLHVATFDHRLRGESSAQDVRFVERTAREWGLPVTSGHADVKGLAVSKGIGLEVAAREARYEFLAQVALNVGARCVAVAHHADDQAETVLMHIIRGTGIEGLRGMLPAAPLPGHPQVKLIRPFLTVTRSQIEAYCRDNDLRPREDVTNRDTTLLRNYVRWEMLPHLQRLNPNVSQALAQLGDIAAVEDSYMAEQLQQAAGRHVSIEGQRVFIPRDIFRSIHLAMQRRFVTWAVGQVAPGAQEVGHVHVVSAVDVGVRGRVGAVALLPDGLRLRVDYGQLVIERASDPLPVPHVPLLESDEEIPVVIPGVTRVSETGWMLKASLQPENSYQCRLDIPEGCAVSLRTRHAGDRFSPLGMGGQHQKIGRWMTNRKVPQALRQRVPLLVVDGEIAAIVLGTEWPVSEHFAVKESTRRTVYFVMQSDTKNDC